MIKFVLTASLWNLLLATPLAAADQSAELKAFQGWWQVTELSEDGRVIPREAIPEWLPSGGKLEIAENAIIITNPHDGQKSVKVFSIDATRYPRGLDIATRDKSEAKGIYRFDEGRLVVCLADSESGERPTEFSAPEGSKRMLMVLKQMPVPAPQRQTPAKAEPVPIADDGISGKVLTDAEVTKLLVGKWLYRDDAGSLIVTLTDSGNWTSVREIQELRLFQKVFVRTPISTGKWSVQNGTLTFHCLTSIQASRVNQQLPFTVRSVSQKDFIFVDYFGRLGKAMKVQ